MHFLKIHWRCINAVGCVKKRHAPSCMHKMQAILSVNVNITAESELTYHSSSNVNITVERELTYHSSFNVNITVREGVVDLSL